MDGGERIAGMKRLPPLDVVAYSASQKDHALTGARRRPLLQGRRIEAPTLRILSYAGECPSPLTSADTRLTEPARPERTAP